MAFRWTASRASRSWTSSTRTARDWPISKRIDARDLSGSAIAISSSEVLDQLLNRAGPRGPISRIASIPNWGSDGSPRSRVVSSSSSSRARDHAAIRRKCRGAGPGRSRARDGRSASPRRTKKPPSPRHVRTARSRWSTAAPWRRMRCGRWSSKARCSSGSPLGDLDDVDDFVTRMNVLHLLGAARGRRPGIVSRRPRPALPAPALCRRAGQRHRSGALVAGRRSRPRKDHRGVAHPQPARAHGQGDALPGGGARHADRAVARRAVAEVSPGVHAARLGSPRRRGARISATTSTPSSCIAAR